MELVGVIIVKIDNNHLTESYIQYSLYLAGRNNIKLFRHILLYNSVPNNMKASQKFRSYNTWSNHK
jgi:hypothetical protein